MPEHPGMCCAPSCIFEAERPRISDHITPRFEKICHPGQTLAAKPVDEIRRRVGRIFERGPLFLCDAHKDVGLEVSQVQDEAIRV